MSDAVQEMFEKLLGILNLWVSTVIYGMFLGNGKCYHSKYHLQCFYYNSLELRIITVNKTIPKPLYNEGAISVA